MTTYDASSVSDAVIAFRKPITLQQGRGLRDNTIAIAEGSADAPRVQGVALGGVHIYSGNLSTTPVAFTGLDRMGKIRIDYTSSHSTTSYILIAFSSDNGSSWGSDQNLVTGSTSNVFQHGNVVIDVEDGSYFLQRMTVSNSNAVSVGSVSSSLTIPADANAFRLSESSGITSSASVYILGGYS